MAENITLRKELVGSVTDFCNSSGLEIINNALSLVELIVLLSNYTEEGKELTPEVYLTNNIEYIMKLLPEGVKLKIGSAVLDQNLLKMCIKKCAPLSSPLWHIYISKELESEDVEYGLFRGTTNSIAVGVEETIISTNDDTHYKVVKIAKVASSCVEVKSNNANKHTIFFNDSKDDVASPTTNIKALAAAITGNLEQSIQEPTNVYVHRVLKDVIRASHGCLVAVTNSKAIPKYLRDDAIILERPIDFHTMVTERKNNTLTDGELQSVTQLLGGIFNSDGIVIFNGFGQLTGYNCFIKANKKSNAIGGARKRAYEALAEKVGLNKLSFAFMRSQDGHSNHKERK